MEKNRSVRRNQRIQFCWIVLGSSLLILVGSHSFLIFQLIYNFLVFVTNSYTTVAKFYLIGEIEIISRKRTTQGQGYPSNMRNWYNHFGFNIDRFNKTFNNHHCQITQVWVGYMHAFVSDIFVGHEIAQKCCSNSWSTSLYTGTTFFSTRILRESL